MLDEVKSLLLKLKTSGCSGNNVFLKMPISFISGFFRSSLNPESIVSVVDNTEHC